MLSQARSDRASPPPKPAAAAADQAKDAVKGLLGRTGREAGDARFEIVGQQAELLPLRDLPDKPGASRALPQEMANELTILPRGELQSEEALDDLVREVLVLHVILPEKNPDLH